MAHYDGRKDSLKKSDFASDLEYWIFRFGNAETIQELVVENAIREGLVSREKIQGIKDSSKLKTEQIIAIRAHVSWQLSGRTMVLRKSGYQPLEVTFRSGASRLTMVCEQIAYKMQYTAWEQSEAEVNAYKRLEATGHGHIVAPVFRGYPQYKVCIMAKAWQTSDGMLSIEEGCRITGENPADVRKAQKLAGIDYDNHRGNIGIYQNRVVMLDYAL